MPEILTVAPAVVGQWICCDMITSTDTTMNLSFNTGMAATGKRKMQTRGLLPTITVLNSIVTPDSGSTMLFNIVNSPEQCGQQNTVQYCFRQLGTSCSFFAV